jgi:alpha-glucosidase
MLLRSCFIAYSLLLVSIQTFAQRSQQFTVQSPDKKLSVVVSTGDSISWSATLNGTAVVEKGKIGMLLATGEYLGAKAVVSSSKTTPTSTEIKTLTYKRDVIQDVYTELNLSFKQRFRIVFRVYDDAIAYRFVTEKKDSLVVKNETASFQFNENDQAYVPYVNNPRNKDIYCMSFENTYEHLALNKIKRDTLAFLPVLIERGERAKVLMTEADLENYPGMFVKATGNGFKGVFAPYPLAEEKSKGKERQSFVTKRADYIARVAGSRSFPWRVVVVVDEDRKLLDNDIVYKLASPSRLKDVSWVRPGKVAWDWWNDWNLSGVDFKSGVNTETYKHYVDFASANGIEYILLDEGWAANNNLMKIIPEIDLKEIIRYADSKHVKVWLWAGWLPLQQRMDSAFAKYSAMGVVGFKIDFMDRDDQKVVQFYYRTSEKAVQYKMMLDFHGAYKPTGLHRTYPNVLNFEGVFGLENAKWTNPDFPKYDCTIPFIRMVAGPLDYTPGAMGNETKANFRPSWSSPVSQGTRCHQLALYLLFDAPLVMLADSPTKYERETESTKFISNLPTTYDETRALDGKISEYAVIARRKKTSWYIGAATNWTSRTVSIDLSFLGDGTYQLESFQDGVNADKSPADYAVVTKTVKSTDKLTVRMEAGGGFAAKLTRISQ